MRLRTDSYDHWADALGKGVYRGIELGVDHAASIARAGQPMTPPVRLGKTTVFEHPDASWYRTTRFVPPPSADSPSHQHRLRIT